MANFKKSFTYESNILHIFINQDISQKTYEEYILTSEFNSFYLPWVWTRIQLAVMSVVTVKYGSHRSSMCVSPNVLKMVWLKSLPENIEVTGYVRSRSWRHHWVNFCGTQTMYL